MLMPNRNSQSNLQGGFSSGGTTTVNGNTYVSNLTVTTRIGNTPNTYKAANNIEFVGEYTDNGGEEYEAFIVNQTNPDPNPTTGTVNSSSIDGYRYGFGGHEKDNEVSGEGNHLAFGDYGYDTRLGRRWNVDPKFNKIPNWSPYTYSLDNPISVSDPDGEFPIYFMIRRYESSKYFGTPFISKGDARQTSIDVTKSARIHHLIGVETNTPVAGNPVFYNNARSSESRQYTPWPGRGTEVPTSSAYGDVLTNNDRTSTLNFNYKSAGQEPIAKKFCESCTPAIDTKGIIGVNEFKKKGELQIFGSINGDNFPDAEGFIYDASGNGISLGDFQHSKYGSPMKDLQGEGYSPLINFDITVKIDKKGNFKSASYMKDSKAVPLKVYSQKETNFTALKQEEKK
jgi:hypothetical protein